MKFSLILATVGRTKELDAYLSSLEKQTFKDFELIISDQNKNGEIDTILENYKNKFNLKHLKLSKIALSHARNEGIKIATGNIISFPDDDCGYPEDLLQKTNDIFETNNYDFISGIVADKNSGKPSSGSWNKQKCTITCKNMLQTAMSASLFVKLEKNNKLFFDERFGIGADFGSAEESDYIFNLLKLGKKGYYVMDELVVYHPNKIIKFWEKENRLRVFTYGLGLGAFFKKHLFNERAFCLKNYFFRLFIVRPVGGIILSVIKFDLNMCLYYCCVLFGRWNGLIKFK